MPSRWNSAGAVPPSWSGPGSDRAAVGSSSRIYYTHKDTGEHCWRMAGWGEGQRFVDSGPGRGCDADGRPNGKTYDEAEFDGTWTNA